MEEISIQQFIKAEDYFFKGISPKTLNLGASATAYMTGVATADLNLVYIRESLPAALQQILTNAKAFFEQDTLPFIVLMPEENCLAEIELLLKTLGYTQKGKSVAMALNVTQLKFNRHVNIDDKTQIKANDTLLSEWMIPLIEAFDSTFNMATQYANVHEEALKNKINLHHFSLYKAEKPIASMTLSIHDNIARIDDVGTLPEFQGRGYATHLMQHALLEAQKLGATDCYLEASETGLSIYEQLGFKVLFKNNIYEFQPS